MSEFYGKTNLSEILSSYWFTVYRNFKDFAAIYDITLTKLSDLFSEAIRIGLSNIAPEFAVLSKKKWHIVSFYEDQISKIEGITSDTDKWEIASPDNIDSLFFITKQILDFDNIKLSGKDFEIRDHKLVLFKSPEIIFNKDIDHTSGKIFYWAWGYKAEIWDEASINKWSKLLELSPDYNIDFKYATIGALHFLVGGPTKKNLITLITGCLGLPVVTEPVETIVAWNKTSKGDNLFRYDIITDKNIYVLDNIEEADVNENILVAGNNLTWGTVFTNIVKVYTNQDKLRRMVAGYFTGQNEADGLEIDHIITNDVRLYRKKANKYLYNIGVGNDTDIAYLDTHFGADYTGRIVDPAPGKSLDAATHFLDQCPNIIGVAIKDTYKNKLNNFFNVLSVGTPNWAYVILSYGDRYNDILEISEPLLADSANTNQSQATIPDNTIKTYGDINSGEYRVIYNKNIDVVSAVTSSDNIIPINTGDKVNLLNCQLTSLEDGKPLVVDKDYEIIQKPYGIKSVKSPVFLDFPSPNTNTVNEEVVKIYGNYIIFAAIDSGSNTVKFSVVDKNSLIQLSEITGPSTTSGDHIDFCIINNYLFLFVTESTSLKAYKIPLSVILGSQPYTDTSITIDSWLSTERPHNFKIANNDNAIFVVYDPENSVKLAIVNPETLNYSTLTLNTDIYFSTNRKKLDIDINSRDYVLIIFYNESLTDNLHIITYSNGIITGSKNNIPFSALNILIQPLQALGLNSVAILSDDPIKSFINITFTDNTTIDTMVCYALDQDVIINGTGLVYKNIFNSDINVLPVIDTVSSGILQGFLSHYSGLSYNIKDIAIDIISLSNFTLTYSNEELFILYKSGGAGTRLDKILKIQFDNSDCIKTQKNNFNLKCSYAVSTYLDNINYAINNEFIPSLSKDKISDGLSVYKHNNSGLRFDDPSFGKIDATICLSCTTSNEIVKAVGNVYGAIAYTDSDNSLYLVNTQDLNNFKIYNVGFTCTNILYSIYNQYLVGFCRNISPTSTSFFRAPLHDLSSIETFPFSSNISEHDYDTICVNPFNGDLVKIYLEKEPNTCNARVDGINIINPDLEFHDVFSLTIGTDTLSNIFNLRIKYDKVYNRYISPFLHKRESDGQYELVLIFVRVDQNKNITLNYRLLNLGAFDDITYNSHNGGVYGIEIFHVNGETILLIPWKCKYDTDYYLYSEILKIAPNDDITVLQGGINLLGGNIGGDYFIGPTTFISAYNVLLTSYGLASDLPGTWKTVVSKYRYDGTLYYLDKVYDSDIVNSTVHKNLHGITTDQTNIYTITSIQDVDNSMAIIRNRLRT